MRRTPEGRKSPEPTTPGVPPNEADLLWLPPVAALTGPLCSWRGIHRDERASGPPRDPLQLHVGGRPPGDRAAPRAGGVAAPRGTPDAPRHGPERAPPREVLRGDPHPPAEPLPLPGAGGLGAAPAAVLREHREGPRPRRAERERRGARAGGPRGLPAPARGVRGRGGRGARAAPQDGAGARGGGREGQRPVRPVHDRLPRDRRDRLAPPPPRRGGDAGRRGAGRPGPRGDRPPGAQGDPARGRHRPHRRRGAPARRLRDREHREAEPHPPDDGADVPARRRARGPRAGRGARGRGHHGARDGARRRARPRVRDRSDERVGLHHRGEHRGERGRQGLRPLRHLHRQPDLVADGDAVRAPVGDPAGRSPAPEDPAGGHRHLRGRRRGRRRRAPHRAARRRHPQEGALEGHHEQGAGRRPGPPEGGHRRRHHLGGVHPLPGARGAADPVPRVLRAGLRRGLPGDPGARPVVPLPERREGGALGARALRRRVRPRHPVQGEGGPGRDAEGGAARGRRRARARGGRARRREDPPDPGGPPEHAPLRGARRGGGEALLGGPQEARRHRAADQRVQDERGRRAPARGARGVRALRRGGERRGGALRAGALRRAGAGGAPRRDAARRRPGVARGQDPRGARAVRAGPRRHRPLGRARAALARDPARAPPGGLAARPRVPRDHEAARAGAQGRSATGSSSSRRTCTPATATCT